MPRPLCPHRGHVLKNGVCPYHAMQSAKFNCSETKVSEVDPTWAEKIEEDLGAIFFTFDMPVKAPASLWMQNTMDHHHVPIIHKDTLSQVFETHIPFDVCISDNASSHRLKVKPEVVNTYLRICGNLVTDSFYHVVSYPNLSVTSFLNVFYSFETVKDNSEGCRVTTKFFRSKSNPIPGALAEAAIEMNKRILKEDRAIVESWAETYADITHCNWLSGEDRIKAYCEYHNSSTRHRKS